MPLHELLGEALAGLQLRGGARGAEDRPAALLKFIDHAERERQFRTDDGEVGIQAVGELHQRVEALEVDGNTFGVGGDAAVARRAIQLLDARRLPQLPNHRVFATTATEDQDLHRRDSATLDVRRKKRVGRIAVDVKPLGRASITPEARRHGSTACGLPRLALAVRSVPYILAGKNLRTEQ